MTFLTLAAASVFSVPTDAANVNFSMYWPSSVALNRNLDIGAFIWPQYTAPFEGLSAEVANVIAPEPLTVNTLVGLVPPLTAALAAPGLTVLESSSVAVTSPVAAISNEYKSLVPETALLDRSALTNNVLEVPAGMFQFRSLKVIVPVPLTLNELLVTLPLFPTNAPEIESHSSTLDMALATETASPPLSTPSS